MAGGDELVGLAGVGGALGAMLFMGAGTNVYDAFSAVMSSPWSTEKFTNDPEEEAMAREYVKHAIVISWIYAGGGAALAYATKPALALWPIIGALIVTVYMFWLYNRALKRSTSSGSMQAATPSPTPPPAL